MVFESYTIAFKMPPLNAWSSFLVRELKHFLCVWDIALYILYLNVNRKSDAVEWYKMLKREKHT